MEKYVVDREQCTTTQKTHYLTPKHKLAVFNVYGKFKKQQLFEEGATNYVKKLFP